MNSHMAHILKYSIWRKCLLNCIHYIGILEYFTVLKYFHNKRTQKWIQKCAFMMSVNV